MCLLPAFRKVPTYWQFQPYSFAHLFYPNLDESLSSSSPNAAIDMGLNALSPHECLLSGNIYFLGSLITFQGQRTQNVHKDFFGFSVKNSTF